MSSPGGVLHRVAQSFQTSLRLGLTSFGGPVAHLGYFERTYVKQLQWLSAEEYSQTVALCQLLPGPTSSQVNFLIGMRHAGWRGGIASWAGFTLPSAIALFAFAVFAPGLQSPMMLAVLHGLKLVAVSVVAQAVFSMARRLCPDLPRAGIAIVATAAALLPGNAFAQIGAIALGGVAGWLLCRRAKMEGGPVSIGVPRKLAKICGALFFILLAALPLLALVAPNGIAPIIDITYRAGALVFGGGHVVLPLLRDALVPPGILNDDTFLAGYGAAQAMPGPLFTLAAYLGAAAAPEGFRTVWAIGALLFIFLPGLLAATAGASVWQWLVKHPAAPGALAGVNAAVVGILAAAFYNPVWKSAILGLPDIFVAMAGFLLLERLKAPPLVVVTLCVVSAVLLHLAGKA